MGGLGHIEVVPQGGELLLLGYTMNLYKRQAFMAYHRGDLCLWDGARVGVELGESCLL